MKWWSNRIKNTFSLTGFSESRLRRLPENQARERYAQFTCSQHIIATVLQDLDCV